MEQVFEVVETLDEERLCGLLEARAQRVVLDLRRCQDFSPRCTDQLRQAFNTLVCEGVDLRVRGASPEFTTQCNVLRIQALMRCAERRNPGLFSMAG